MDSNAGDSIKAQNSGWTFDGIEENFDDHIKKSVPLYQETQKLGVELADFFVTQNSTVYDIGCSTGVFLNNLWEAKKEKKPKLVGIDSIQSMIDHAEERKAHSSIEFVNASIYEYEMEKASYITSFYTIQFIPPPIRQEIINKIYNSLEWGGAFLMIEKVRAPDARFQDITSQIYHEFKLQNGYAAEEILQKQVSLKSVLDPFSTEGNLGLLKRAGFVDMMTIFKYVSFEGLLCIK